MTFTQIISEPQPFLLHMFFASNVVSNIDGDRRMQIFGFFWRA
jgi:hypothetical protein